MPRIVKALLASLALALSLTPAAFCQQPTFHDDLLDHLAGKWVLQGAIAGQKTVHDVDAQWVLEHQYLSIHEVSREKTARGVPTYEANVFIGWDQKLAQYVCVWLDTYGGMSPESFAGARRHGDEIPFIFKGTDSATHTT